MPVQRFRSIEGMNNAPVPNLGFVDRFELNRTNPK